MKKRKSERTYKIGKGNHDSNRKTSICKIEERKLSKYCYFWPHE
jgi:hypothetical protein